ncbi:MAG: sensor histidine kinase [Methyloligellaceae bacterium]
MTDQSISILIADDDEGDRELLIHELDQTGLPYVVTETASSDTILNSDTSLPYDCAFIDYNMPEHNGLDVISILRKRSPYMSIVMFSGEGNEMVASEAFKRGASDYITKSSISSNSIKRIITNTLTKMELQKKIDQQRDNLLHFSRVLAHDIKSPINQMLSLCEYIVNDIAKGDYSQLELYCKYLKHNGDHSISLIDALNEYNQALDCNVTFERISANNLIEDVIIILHDTIQNSQATITHDDLPQIQGNMPQLRQLLQNLVANGLKYCKSDHPKVHVSAEEVKDFWQFSVRDNGIGISQDHYGKIFEPFSRLHGQKEFSGTGLGLATCQKIVERHKGNIWCESEKEKGSTFFFTIPK